MRTFIVVLTAALLLNAGVGATQQPPIPQNCRIMPGGAEIICMEPAPIQIKEFMKEGWRLVSISVKGQTDGKGSEVAEDFVERLKGTGVEVAGYSLEILFPFEQYAEVKFIVSLRNR